MGLEAALAWKTCTFGLTKKLPCLDSSFTKILLNHTAIFGSFSFPNEQRYGGNSTDLILVGKCHLSLSDYRKEEITRSMNLINGFGARGYVIRGIHLPIVLLT